MLTKHRWRVAFLLGTPLLLAHLLLSLPLSVTWRGSAALLVLGFPGLLLASLWFADEADPLLRCFLGLCGALVLAPCLLLALQALPGPLPWWLLLAASDLLSLGLIGLHARQSTPGRRPLRTSASGLPVLLLSGLVLLLGAGLRLPWLGSAEFDYDEAVVMHAAMDVLRGQDGALLLHRKGPIEVLLPAGPMILSGQINETVARLPFALAGVGTLLGALLLAQRLLSATGLSSRASNYGAVAAATILALDGFLIAFARIVQYQSVLVLLLIAAVWCCWAFYSGAAQTRRLLLPAALLTAVALLTHYDAIFVLPALLWLLLAGGRRRRWGLRQWGRELALPAFVAGALLLSFYLPFALQAAAGRTSNYLLWRLTGGTGTANWPVNNLPNYFQAATFYNTTFQIAGYAGVLLISGLVWLWRYCRPAVSGIRLPLLLVLGAAVVGVAAAQLELINGAAWVAAAFALPLGLLACAPATPAVLRTLILWFAPPFLAESFLIAIPNTHFYTMDVPAALLLTLAGVQLDAWLRRRGFGWPRLALASSGAAAALLAVVYMLLVFVRPVPEYQRVFPAARPAIYYASYGDRLPAGSFLGFPHRDGWKVLGELYRQGLLYGSYRSNQSSPITRWYLRDSAPDDQPNYYFAALFAGQLQVPAGYALVGQVLVEGIKTLEIYSRLPASSPMQVFTLDAYSAAFDAQQLSTAFVPPAPAVPHPWPADFGESLHFRGYDVRVGVKREPITLALHWQVRQPPHEEYMLFVHVLDSAGQRVGQLDVPFNWGNTSVRTGTPEEYLSPVQLVPLKRKLPAGTYWIALGLYNPRDGSRVPLRAPAQPNTPTDGEDALLLDPITLP
jgi:hypothetical protein